MELSVANFRKVIRALKKGEGTLWFRPTHIMKLRKQYCSRCKWDAYGVYAYCPKCGKELTEEEMGNES